ncbi:MAG: class I SAM-dependent methyltransferase [Bacteroidota bacterium]
MRVFLVITSIFFLAACTKPTSTDAQEAKEYYTFKKGSYDGIGKWYLGREIAFVMGYQGISWLERVEREREEETSKLIQFLNIGDDDVIADIGAGSGYHVFRMAPKAPNGIIYGVDIQQEMLDAMQRKIASSGIENVRLIKGSEQTVNLPENAVDKVLMVDVYHEFSFPFEMMQSISKALKPKGKIYLIEYRGEDPTVPIKPLHKMTEKQAVKEMSAAGFEMEENKKGLPWQHCMVFVKKN